MAGEAPSDKGGVVRGCDHRFESSPSDLPEYTSSTMMIWTERQGIALNHTQPGKPQQNHLTLT